MRHAVKEDLTDELTIEDKPRIIQFGFFTKIMKQHWKSGISIVLIFGLLLLIVSPSGGFTGYKAETTLYTPASTRRKVDNRIYVISNNLSQLNNMVELIQSQVYRDAIAQETGIDNLRKIGSFTVERIDNTDLISIVSSASSKENAEKLCNAVVAVMTEQLGKKVSINDMVSVDSIKSYSVTTPSTLLSSFIKGCLAGAVIWFVYVLMKSFTDRKFRSAGEVEDDLQLPVFTVLPSVDRR